MTTTKLRELAERCEISSESRGVVQCLRCEICKKRDVRQVIPLARLVLDLEAALRDVETFIKPKHYRAIEVIAKALAAVEELEL